MKREPLFANNARIHTPLGIGVVRSSRPLRANPNLILYEVQLDRDSCIRTWTEAELTIALPDTPPPPIEPRTVYHFVPGETVSTLEGEGIIRNLLREAVSGIPHALVQLIGTTRTIEVPCSDLGPPLEPA